MQVAVYYNNRDIRIQDMPVPKIGDDEILVKVITSGICGSDVMEWYRIKQAPRVLGHEITGKIVKVGQAVKNYKVGQRVFVSHHVPCNTCHYCLSDNHTICDTLRNTNYFPGGFSEYIRVPKINVKLGTFVLPDMVSYEEGVFIEPLACVVRGQMKANISRGQTVLIVGSGVSGILHIALSKINGAKKIIAIDINKYRLQLAKKFGADEVYLPHPPLDKGGFRGRVDKVIVCTNVPGAISTAIERVERGGTILFFAPFPPEVKASLPLDRFYFDGITVLPSYGASPRNIKVAIGLLRQKKINVEDMITHRLKLKDIQSGFQIVENAKKSLKVIIEPQNT